MSVTWRAFIGYGFPVDIDAIKYSLGEDDYLYQDFSCELNERYPLLDTGYAGNAFTSEGMETFALVKSSIVQAYDWTKTFELNQLNMAANGEGVEQLWKFNNDTGAALGEPEWRLFISCG